MDIKELRIGNLIEHQGKIVPVYQIDRKSKTSSKINDVKFENEDTSEYFKPIPLTEDWLLRMGFEEVYDSQFRKKFDLISNPRIGFDFAKVFDYSTMAGFRHIGEYLYHVIYVHQLQNLYNSLTGKELSIKTERR